MLGIQIIFVAGKGTVGLVERKLLVISRFWLQTNQHLYASNLTKKTHKLAATGLQTILEGCQNHHARMSTRSSQ
jgi:hypothetical protein